MAVGRFRFMPSGPVDLAPGTLVRRRWHGLVTRATVTVRLEALFTPLKADAKELRLSHPLVRSGPNVPAPAGDRELPLRLRHATAKRLPGSRHEHLHVLET